MAEIKVIVNEYWTYLSACLHYHLLVIVLLLIASPVPITAVIINHDAYIWQRLWTPALKQAISTASPYIQSWHVLAGQLEANGQMIPVNVDIKALVASRKPVILVFRINGQLAFKPNPDLIAQLVQIIHTYRFQDLNVSGIEIDYDCPTNKLLSYKQFLIALRAALLDQQLPLMITALPTWLNSYDLTSLLQQADAVILQVHAVLNPVQGLFNPDLALRWVEKFSLISPIKFQVALPNYGSRVSWDEQGRLTGVESENNLGLFGHTMQELKVKPEQVSRVLNVWQRSAPKNFAGVVWFRLPTSVSSKPRSC